MLFASHYSASDTVGHPECISVTMHSVFKMLLNLSTIYNPPQLKRPQASKFTPIHVLNYMQR